MKPQIDNGTTRREFIEQMSLLGVASFIPLSFFSCGKDTDDIDYQGTGLAPYKVWEEMLMAVKTSPDFLEGRMQELIENADPKAMFDFVRDEIYLIPPTKTSLSRMGKIMRYGTKGVLRYGFATPREKAELLHKMYKEAGISSEIVYERTDIKSKDVPAFFFRPKDRKFEPKVNQKILNRWQKEMQTEPSTEHLIQVDDNEAESKKLAEQLWNLVPEKEKLRPYEFDFRWDNYRTPTVSFTVGEETKYAHLMDPNVAFGALREGGTTSKAEEAEYTDEKIEITLTARDGINLREDIELLTGSWPLRELAGNQLVLTFANGLTLEQMIVTPIGNLRMFTPVIAFQSFDADMDYMAEKSVIGNTFTLEGDIIDVKSDNPKLNGTALLAKPNPDLQKKVRQVAVKAVPRNYPLVKLEVSPTDENNIFVEGLSAADFKIFDNDLPVAAMMENNQRTPKITLLYDGSGSMPFEYSGKKINEFIENLESEIKNKYPGVNILKWKTDSNLFTSLYKASKQNADIIIYATDGHNNDSYNSDWEKTYNEGPPALILNVHNSTSKYVKTSFEMMAKSTSGVVLDAKDQTKVIETISKYLENLEIPPYVFTYYAVGKEKEHSVKVTMDENRLDSNTNYEFAILPADEMVLGKQLAGLYLTIKTGKQTVNRVLAGWDPLLDIKRKPIHADFKAVKNTILGGASISIEGEGPTLANALADILKHKLSTREFGEAMLQDKTKEAQAAFEKGGYNYNSLLASLMQPIQNGVTAHSLTYASGPRIAIFKYRIGIEETFSTVSFDYLPTSNYVTLSEDVEAGYKTTLQKTAMLALLEKSLFPESTFSQLQNKTLIERSLAIEQKWFEKDNYREGPNAYFWSEKIKRGSGHFKIFDQSASVKAYWQIDMISGELYGVLQDGTGGGANSIEQQLKELNRVMDTYILVLSSMSGIPGVNTMALSIVALYGQLLVKLYAIVCEVIIVMDAHGMDDKIKLAIATFACNVYKTIVLGFMKGPGIAFSGLEYMISMITGKSLCSLK